MSYFKPKTGESTTVIRQRCSPSEVPVAKALYNSSIGIDVHHSVLVCAYQNCNRENEEITTEVRQFGTTSSEIQAFARWCREKNPERILMESTGVLWFSPYETLESVGFTQRELSLINARDFRAVTGRKTDKQDAKRLALFARLGTVRGSFVPSKEFREMRNISRLLIKMTAELSRARSRYLKTLNFVGCRVSSVFSDSRGKAAKAILEVYCQGDLSALPKAIEDNCGRLRKSPEEILDALNFSISPSIAETLRIQHQHMKDIEARCGDLYDLLCQIQSKYKKYIDMLTSIPGIKERAARLMFSEITNDLDSFSDAEHFASWAGVCPGNKESAGKRYSGHAAKGNKYLRAILVECGQAIGLMRRGFLKSLFQSFKETKGTRRAVVAIAHRLIRIIFRLFTRNEMYVENETDALTKVRVRKYIKSAVNVKAQNFDIAEHGILIDKATGALIALTPC